MIEEQRYNLALIAAVNLLEADGSGQNRHNNSARAPEQATPSRRLKKQH
jgi:hypothetical protein